MHPKQEKLIRLYADHFHENYKMGPLQAQIFGYVLIIGKKQGVTFDDILCYTKASKSSVSTSINCLLDRKSIYYNHKNNERKKYFYPNNLASVLERTEKIIKKDIELLIEMMSYYEDVKENENDNKHLNNMRLFKDHLEKIEKSIQDTLHNFE